MELDYQKATQLDKLTHKYLDALLNLKIKR